VSGRFQTTALNASSAREVAIDLRESAISHLSRSPRLALRFLPGGSRLDGLFHTGLDILENAILLGLGQWVERVVRVVGCLEPGQLRTAQLTWSNINRCNFHPTNPTNAKSLKLVLVGSAAKFESKIGQLTVFVELELARRSRLMKEVEGVNCKVIEGKSFVMRADEELATFVELEAASRYFTMGR
jgi:hypothetical protein